MGISNQNKEWVTEKLDLEELQKLQMLSLSIWLVAVLNLKLTDTEVSRETSFWGQSGSLSNFQV